MMGPVEPCLLGLGKAAGWVLTVPTLDKALMMIARMIESAIEWHPVIPAKEFAEALQPIAAKPPTTTAHFSGFERAERYDFDSAHHQCLIAATASPARIFTAD